MPFADRVIRLLAGVVAAALVALGLPLLTASAAQATPTYAISGTVTASEPPGTALAGITVTATDSVSSVVFTDVTDGTGAFSITVPDGSDYSLDFVAIDGHRVPATYADLISVNGADMPGIDVTLAAAGAISGTVLDDSSTPLRAGVTVYQRNALGDLDYVADTTAAADGTFLLGGLAPGNDYVVGFGTGSSCGASSCPQVVEEYWQDQADYSTAQLLAVALGATQNLSPIHVTRYGDVHGTVKIGAAPVANAFVELWPTGGGGDSPAAYDLTAADGTFALPVLPGSYKLHVSIDGYADFWYSGKRDLATATPISVAAETLTLVGVITPVFTGTLLGSITSGGSPVVSGGDVAISDTRTLYRADVPIQGDGTYRVDGLPPGDYRVEAWPAGYDYATATVTVPAAPSTTQDFVVTESLANAAVQVDAETAGALALTTGGTVTAYDLTQGYDVDSCDLAALGSCTLNVPPGQYQLEVQPTDSSLATSYYGGQASLAASTPVTLVAGPNPAKTITVAAAGQLAVTVGNDSSVTQSVGITVSDGTRVVDREYYDGIASGSTTDGPVTIGHLRPGTYTVAAVSEDTGEIVSSDVTVAAGPDTPLLLTLSAETAAEVVSSEPATGNVTGAVSLDGVTPAVGFHVCAFDSWNYNEVCATTDATGHYTLTGLHADTSLYVYVDPKNGYFYDEKVVSHRPTVTNPTVVPTFVLTKGATIGGHVTDGSGAVSDVLVSVVKDGVEQDSAFTTATGTWSATMLDAGSYTVLADAGSTVYEPTWLGSTIDPGAASSRTVAAGANLTDLDVVLQPGRTATTTSLDIVGGTGHVGDSVTLTAHVNRFAPGSAVNSGKVRFYGPDGVTPIGQADVINGVASSLPTTLTTRYAFYLATYTGDVTFGSSQAYAEQDVIGYPTTTTLTVPGSGVAGSSVLLSAQVSSPNGTPAGFVDFYSGFEYLGYASLVGGNGSITTTSLGAGKHSILAVFDDGSNPCGPAVPHSAVNPYGCSVVQTAPVANVFERSSDTKSLTVSQAPVTTGKIKGTVTNGIDPLADVDVALFDAAGTLRRETTTSSTGAFGFGSLAAGSYRVRFSGIDVVTEWWQDQTTLAGATAVPVAVGGTQTLNAVLSQPPGAVSGHVTISGTGDPVADATVNVCVQGVPESVSSCRETYTGIAGAYQVKGLAPGSYVVTVAPTDAGLASASATVPVAAVEVVQDFAVVGLTPPPSSVTLGTPIGTFGGVPVFYWQDPTPLAFQACTGGSATYQAIDDTGHTAASGSMTESPAGSGTFKATMPALYPSHGNVHITMSATCPDLSTPNAAFDVYIDPSGTVKDTHGAPISGATVTLWQFDTGTHTYQPVPDGSAVMSPSNRTNPDKTNAVGHFGWDVVAGHYEVTASKPGCHAVGSTDTTVTSPPLEIPPPVTTLALTLDCTPPVPPATVPGVPATVGATNAGRTATVGWSVPSSGGSPILDYTVTVLQTGASYVVAGTSIAIPNLTPGGVYTFSVRARNAIGYGGTSAASNAVVIPRNGTFTRSLPMVAISPGRPTFRWGITTGDYPVSRVDLQVRTGLVAGGLGGFGPIVSLAGAATAYTLPKVVPGATYCVQVRTVDAVGAPSAWASAGCTAVIADDLSFAASKKGWASVKVKGALGGKARRSVLKGAALVLPKVTGSTLVLVVDKAPAGGTIGVFVKGKLVGKYALASKKFAVGVRLAVKMKASGSPVVISVLAPGKGGVYVDGFTVLK